jgi:hypothetical protein
MRKTTYLEDEIDGPAGLQDSVNRRGPVIRARYVVYLQPLATTLSVLLERCERWAYSGALETGSLAMVFDKVTGALLGSAVLFPFAVFAFLKSEGPWERWAWVAAPLSLVMSSIQILALLPAFE